MRKRFEEAIRRALISAFVSCTSLLLAGWACAAENAAVLMRVTDDVQYLSSDALQGRGPGTRGLEEAADRIVEEFRDLGLASGVRDDSYRQTFDVDVGAKPVPEQTFLILCGPDGERLQLQLGEDFQALTVGGAGRVTAPIVFAGYGISASNFGYDDYADVDVDGKVVLIIRHEPQQDDPNSVFEGQKTTRHATIRAKLQLAKKKQAAAVLIVNDPFTTKAARRDELSSPSGFGARSMGVPFAQLTQATVNRMLTSSPLKTKAASLLGSVRQIEDAIDATLAPLSQPLAGWSAELACAFEQETVEVANIVGVLDGAGPLADETIILGAHYDHIGMGEFGSRKPNSHEVHNGADDNASGTAAIVELARRFAHRQRKPARRLVFIAFSGEEKGLLGSNHYLEQPLFPLSDTVAMFNYDMIGRLRNDELTINGVRTAVEFPELVERANSDEGLKLKKVDRVVRSGDHFGFYQHGVPAFHFFTGFTDEYHTPEDDFETLNMVGVLRTIDYTERLLDEVLALPKRPELVKPSRPKSAAGGVAYLGIVPDYSASAKGLRVSEIAPNSPAAKADLKTGDVIIQFGQSTISDIKSLQTGLRSHRPGDMVKIVVRRGEKDVTCNVTLGRP